MMVEFIEEDVASFTDPVIFETEPFTEGWRTLDFLVTDANELVVLGWQSGHVFLRTAKPLDDQPTED